jgi:hypothetical protein
VFAERYGLKFQTVFRRNSVFITLAALAQAVCRWSFNVEAQVRLHFSPCELRGGQSDIGTRFSPSTLVFLRQYHSTFASCSSTTYIYMLPLPEGHTGKLEDLPKIMLFRKSGSIECKSMFIFQVMSWLRWLFTELDPGPFHVGFITTKCHRRFPPITSVLPSRSFQQCSIPILISVILL